MDLLIAPCTHAAAKKGVAAAMTGSSGMVTNPSPLTHPTKHMHLNQQHDDPEGCLWEAMEDRRHIIPQTEMSLLPAWTQCHSRLHCSHRPYCCHPMTHLPTKTYALYVKQTRSSISNFLNIMIVLTPFYTPLKKTFNTFKRFQADPAKIFSQYSLRVLKQPSPVPNTLKGFSSDPWKISTPPKGSIKTLPPFHFVLPPFFFKLYLTQGFSTDLLNDFIIHLKGLGRTFMKIEHWKILI